MTLSATESGIDKKIGALAIRALLVTGLLNGTLAKAEGLSALNLPTSNLPGLSAEDTSAAQAPSTALPYSISEPLKPGDLVSIDVLGFENLSGQQQVSSNGTVQLPLGGPILVGGSAPSEAASAIEEALLPFVRRPQVGVSLVTASPFRVSVSGEVQEPGPRLLEPVSSDNRAQQLPPTLSTALIASGGITPDADLRNVVIRRPVLHGPALRYEEYRVNLWDAVSQGDLQADPRIFSGDEIIVPAATAASIDQRILLSSTIAPGDIQIQVAGEVNRPGQITVSPTVGVSGAVAAAGGLNSDANPEEVMLLRMQADGRVEQLAFTFGEASAPLTEGDVIVVQPSERGEIGGTFDFIGRILNPFGALFNIFR
ncbi:MAG: polysaccharide biosynthesis/export family protein [Cyanobacteria bacterium P01_D01_bin.105]